MTLEQLDWQAVFAAQSTWRNYGGVNARQPIAAPLTVP